MSDQEKKFSLHDEEHLGYLLKHKLDVLIKCTERSEADAGDEILVSKKFSLEQLS
jgi:hypothetical protein